MNVAGRMKRVPLIESETMTKHVWKHCGEHANGWWDLREWLGTFEPFSNAGKTFHGGPYENVTGRLYLHPETLAEYRERKQFIDYVVWSYQTPIVWHDTERGWVDPGHGYTQATKAKHYGRVAPAVAVLRGEI